MNYCYFLLCEGGRFNGYMITINRYIIMIEWINTRVELMASLVIFRGRKEGPLYFFVCEHPLLYNMFIKAAAEIDEVLWLLGLYSQWLPFIDSVITGRSVSVYCSLLVASRIFSSWSKNKNKNDYINNYILSQR